MAGLGLATVPGLAAQQASIASINRNAPRVDAVAVRAEPNAPRIDGRLDDPAWQTAPVFGDFVQKDPNQGEPATQPTEFRVVYTDDAIFIGVRAFDPDPEEIRAQLTRRDQDSPSDWIIVAIDSYHDRRTGFAFFVNPEGVKRDVYLFNDGESDESWDAVWDVATTTDDQGWVAEFRIPFSQLRFPAASQHTWGFNVVRVVNRTAEEDHWRLMPKGESSIVSRFGDLVGLQNISPPRRVEVMPYAAASSAFTPEEAGNPFATGSDYAGRVGADLNIGVTSNLTLSATINPDFGQVEADPAVVNLSAFETFYPEKRPFFNEGVDIFSFPILLGDGDGANEQLFYSRRIGRAPQGSADPRGGYAESIGQTTILGAAKLSGKTPSGWTVGLLNAVTAEEKADVVDASGSSYQDIVEPRTTYTVGRLARDFRGGLTQVGFFGTAVNRALSDNLNWLRSSAYAGGFNLTHRFADDTYAVDAWLVGSNVRGSPQAIDLTQRSSARYYQRPDNDYVSYDPTRTSLSGLASQLVVSKRRGDKLVWATGFDTRSPGFEVNDAGYQREADRTVQFAWAQLRWLNPGKLFRESRVNFNQWSQWTWGFDRMGVGGNVNGWAQFLNYWSANAGINVNTPGLSTTALRGGPAFLTPRNVSGWGGMQTDYRKSLRAGLNFSWSVQPESDSWSIWMGPHISWRAASNMDFTFSPRLANEYDSWQYVDQVNFGGTDHFLFGRLRQTTMTTTLRGNVTFAPTMSLQIYAEPFVSTGDYQGYRQVADPRGATFADRFDDFGPDRLIQTGDVYAIDFNRDGTADYEIGNPDFTYFSFRSNVVLRWEYMLGSTLFVVWQHGRSGINNNGSFEYTGAIHELFQQPGSNTFVVKFNYWFSL